MKNSHPTAIAPLKAQAFTLIELLVVISIIALLLSILIPSLNKAKELANRVVCGSRLKTLTKGSAAYAAANGGWFVPAGYSPYYNPNDPRPPEENSCKWLENKTYRKYIGMDKYWDIVRPNVMQSPKEFLCPSDKISKDPDNNPKEFNVQTSYEYNVTDWVPWRGGNGTGWKNRIVGHRVDSLNKPAEKLNFIDGIDWWTDWAGARYEARWDIVGQAPMWLYRPVNGHPTPPQPYVYGAVYYRHNEGAVCGFYDGHSEYMKKQKVFDYSAYRDSSSPKQCGMWTSSGWTPAGFSTPYP